MPSFGLENILHSYWHCFYVQYFPTVSVVIDIQIVSSCSQRL